LLLAQQKDQESILAADGPDSSRKLIALQIYNRKLEYMNLQELREEIRRYQRKRVLANDSSSSLIQINEEEGDNDDDNSDDEDDDDDDENCNCNAEENLIHSHDENKILSKDHKENFNQDVCKDTLITKTKDYSFSTGTKNLLPKLTLTGSREVLVDRLMKEAARILDHMGTDIITTKNNTNDLSRSREIRVNLSDDDDDDDDSSNNEANFQDCISLGRSSGFSTANEVQMDEIFLTKILRVQFGFASFRSGQRFESFISQSLLMRLMY
jgi:hypothetical protein